MDELTEASVDFANVERPVRLLTTTVIPLKIHFSTTQKSLPRYLLTGYVIVLQLSRPLSLEPGADLLCDCFPIDKLYHIVTRSHGSTHAQWRYQDGKLAHHPPLEDDDCWCSLVSRLFCLLRRGNKLDLSLSRVLYT